MLPSNTEKNPKGQCQAITTRSGKQYSSSFTLNEDDVVIPGETDKTEPEQIVEEHKDVEKDKPLMREYQPKIPYPARLK